MMSDRPSSHDDYEILTREILYQGIFCLSRYTIKHRLYDGEWSTSFQREVFERHSAAAILPYDPWRDRVILIEQFRPGALSGPNGPWLLEIPAGILGKNEKPDQVAYREAHEESGCIIKELCPIFDYFVSPGGSNEYINLYCGKIDSNGIQGVHGLKTEQEDILVLNLPTEEALAMLNSNKIKTAPAIISLLWLKLHRKQLQDNWTS